MLLESLADVEQEHQPVGMPFAGTGMMTGEAATIPDKRR